MRVALAMAAWIVALLPRDGVPARTLPGIEDEAFSQACVRAHNKFRSEVSPRASDMLYMVRGAYRLTRGSLLLQKLLSTGTRGAADWPP